MVVLVVFLRGGVYTGVLRYFKNGTLSHKYCSLSHWDEPLVFKAEHIFCRILCMTIMQTEILSCFYVNLLMVHNCL